MNPLSDYTREHFFCLICKTVLLGEIATVALFIILARVGFVSLFFPEIKMKLIYILSIFIVFVLLIHFSRWKISETFVGIKLCKCLL